MAASLVQARVTERQSTDETGNATQRERLASPTLRGAELRVPDVIPGMLRENDRRDDVGVDERSTIRPPASLIEALEANEEGHGE